MSSSAWRVVIGPIGFMMARTLPHRRDFLAVSEERYVARIPDGPIIRTMGSNNRKNSHFTGHSV